MLQNMRQCHDDVIQNIIKRGITSYDTFVLLQTLILLIPLKHIHMVVEPRICALIKKP